MQDNNSTDQNQPVFSSGAEPAGFMPPEGGEQPVIPPQENTDFMSPESNMPPFIKEQYEAGKEQTTQPSQNITEQPNNSQAQFEQQAADSNSPQKGGALKKIMLLVGTLVIVLLIVVVGVTVIFPRLKGSLPTQKKGEIVWWGLWEDDAIIKPLIEEYEKKHSGVTIKYVAQSKADYRDRLNNALASGNGPDVFRIHNTWVPMFTNKLAVLPNNVMPEAEFQATFYPVAYKDLKIQAGIVGIPLEYDGLALFVNEDIFATYFKPVPKTWEEVESTAKELTIRDDSGVIQQAGIALGTTKTVDHWQEIIALFLLQNGVDPNNLAANPELTTQALSFYTRFNKEMGVWDDTQPNSTVAFAAGRLAMYFAPSWRAFEIWEQNPALKFRTYSVPQLNKANPNDPDITYATYWVESVNEASENKDLAWDFLQFLSQKESLQKFYENASKVRKFGEPYPRRDMQSLLANDLVLGGVIEDALTAQSWYLASRTFDGQTGINAKMSQYFENTLNQLLGRFGGLDASRQITTLNLGINQVLSEYGLATPIPTPAN